MLCAIFPDNPCELIASSQPNVMNQISWPSFINHLNSKIRQKAPQSSLKASILGLGSLGLMLMMSSPSLALEIRVAIQQNIGSLTVGSSEEAQLKNGSGQVLANVNGKKSISSPGRFWGRQH